MDEELRSLSSAFHRHVTRRPDAVAVTDGDVTVTYAELAACASGIRASFAALGLAPGDRVGIFMRRSWKVVAAVVAVVGHGCTYVPLDPDYPEERVRFMAGDSELRAVCADPGAAWPSGDVPAVEVDGTPAPVEPPAARSPEVPTHVIYTSGSTGRPKGVATPEGAVLELFRSARERFSFGPGDVWTWFHSHCFDFSVWEIWGPLVHGGRLVVVPPATGRDPRRLLRTLAAERVTVLCQVPSMFKYLAWAMEQEPVPLALRYLIFGGEAIDRDTIRRWMDLTGGREEIVNIYGPTETTVFATCTVVDRQAVLDTSSPTNIGRPLRHVRTAVVAESGVPVGAGAEGELWVGGTALAAGYLKRPELNAERFPVVDLGDGERRWYRTGDLVRRLADGSFQYLGRIDSQVKIRGFRIELGEIESVLRGVPGVSDAAVVVRTPPGGEPLLVAYLVGEPPEPAALRAVCGRSLPAHMVPARFRTVAALPLNPNGKLDRLALEAQR
ncbi:Dimodular nonribosomal peptide synthase [Nonomuraea coxensis DSM 45129]|uniref:Dimodular nonribosomal peptide synthase n=1 Tax=Nonomuraea coxensis DSM 45129 TaxID=1122611 RepID=A0ABX8U1H1_9ACTN|nr:amino acid adenylation domain-containing protein [Nonomuraea coxensis]QYC41597.1 Dimodular nonribosomal peptide synthase [Nonomuraea coxensis DSM 45129]